MDKYDFSGWATRNDLLCGDGRTIRRNAFKDCDGETVPLVYNHDHGNPDAVLGHALLENRDDGVYAYCSLNDTESGEAAKKLVQHGDVRSLSIYANKLKQIGNDVIHGTIRELSLVLAGANPGAYIDFVMEHGDDGDASLTANYDENALVLYHAEEQVKEEPKMADNKKPDSEKTVKDVFDTLTEEQKTVVYAMIGQALESANETENDNEEDSKMKHNVFDNEDQNKNVLSHSDMESIISNLKRYGSLKDSVVAHCNGNDELYHAITDSNDNSIEYGIADIDYLFPEARNLNLPPRFIQRDMGWVNKVMSGTHHTPFSRIKSMFADITVEDARAKGYIKGNQKTEEVFGLLKRTTTPTTIYKKQKLDRDDIVDITDFDVVAWLKAEMRLTLNEEIARAVLVGDGRSPASNDKVNEGNIRPIWKDEDLYTIKQTITVAPSATDDDKAKAFIRAAIKSRKNYKGSGSPTLYTTEDMITDCLLLEDGVGRILYESVDKLATTLRVKEIVTVPVMENLTREVSGVDRDLAGIIVNLADYNIGADKGGAVNLFDDFDIDYNQQKYLIETRCSGALTVPYSAIALEFVESV